MAGPLDLMEFLNQRNAQRVPTALDMQSPEVDPMTAAAQVAMAASASGSPSDGNAPGANYGLRMPASAETSLTAEYNSPANQQLRKRIEDEFLKSQQSQNISVAELEKYLSGYRDKNEVNLAPLMALADSWSDGDSNLAKAYQAPDSADEKAYKVAQIQDMIAKRKGDMSKEELGFLKSQLSDKMGLRMFETEQRNARAGRAFDKDTAKYVSERFNKDIFNEGTARDFAQTETDFNTLQSNLGAGDLLSFSTGISNYARQVGGQKGVLTDRDISLLRPATLDAKLKEIQTFFDNNPGKPLPKGYIEPYMEIMNRVRAKVADQKLSQIERLNKEMLGTGFTADAMVEGGSGHGLYRTSKDRIEAFRNGRAQYEGGKETTAAAAPAAGQILSPQEWLKQNKKQ